MPLPLSVFCFSKIQMVLPFWYQLTRVVPDKVPLNGCMRMYVCMYQYSFFLQIFPTVFSVIVSALCTMFCVVRLKTVDWRQCRCNSDFCVCQKDEESASAVTCHFGRFSHSFLALYKPDLVPAGWSMLLFDSNCWVVFRRTRGPRHMHRMSGATSSSSVRRLSTLPSSHTVMADALSLTWFVWLSDQQFLLSK